MVPNTIQIENSKQEVSKKEFKTKAYKKANLCKSLISMELN